MTAWNPLTRFIVIHILFLNLHTKSGLKHAHILQTPTDKLTTGGLSGTIFHPLLSIPSSIGIFKEILSDSKRIGCSGPGRAFLYFSLITCVRNTDYYWVMHTKINNISTNLKVCICIPCHQDVHFMVRFFG